MGYILPISHYQYNDYQNRITETKPNPHYIERPFKVILEEQHQRIEKEYERLNGQVQQSPSKKDIHANKFFEQITGKGKNFSAGV
ncbi:hypothetical protein [Oceanobacillus jordanicus]|uniref:Transposase n=1 Tax=Oceanobacillus jordanicus TaxID=2867266 RepID=A0AAW5B089_9BACI|nr:hypothetical protein [Oceanobacillus jordanicus]MCG3418375.1 hypothetical protein [Oceanobacillus jordanicus]